jgi:high-affinity nickel-transport protein
MSLDMALRLGGGGVLGLLLGLRHAFEPDHLAAVAALTAERRSMRAGALLGATWGCGHTVSLLAASVALAVMEGRVPRWIDNALALVVAAMLMVLGARAVFRVALNRSGGAGDPLPHDGAHAGWSSVRRPLLVGVVHGLAGSGSLTALVMASLPSTGARLAYVALFGIGSTVGMALLTAAASWPLARLASGRSAVAVAGFLAGGASLGIGAWSAAAAISHAFSR